MSRGSGRASRGRANGLRGRGHSNHGFSNRGGHAQGRPHNGYSKPQLTDNSNWRQGQDLRIRVFNLPRDADTGDVYQIFNGKGFISRIDVRVDDKNDNRNYAIVTFNPLPAREIWLPEIQTVVLPDYGQFQVRLQKMEPGNVQPITSPADPARSYPRCMVRLILFFHRVLRLLTITCRLSTLEG